MKQIPKHDIVIFVIVFVIPYLSGGPWNWMYSIPQVGAAGPGVVAFLLSLYIYCFSIQNGLRSQFPILSKLIWIAALYTVFELIRTTFMTGIIETLTIYRKNYIYILSFALIMTYISNMTCERIYRIGRLIFIWCIPITFIYFMQCLGVPIFTDTLLSEKVGGVEVSRNILGMPPVFPVIFAISVSSMIYTYSKRSLYFTLMFVVVCFISYTRNLMLTSFIVVFFSLVLYVMKYGMQENYKLIGYTMVIVIGLIVFAPNSLNFWTNLLDSTINVQLEKGIGTYAFRQKLIEYSILKITEINHLLTGIGYVRDVARGEYSIVLGGDTYVAPILWCEGVFGLLLRCLPIIFLLGSAYKSYREYQDVEITLPSIVIVVSVFSQIPNYVQTTIFMNYCASFAQLFILYTFIHDLKNTKVSNVKNFSYYSFL